VTNHPLRARVHNVLTRPGGGDIRMGELVKALGVPERAVRRVVAELLRAKAVTRRQVATESGCPDHVFVRPAATARALGASGINAVVDLRSGGGIRHPKRKGFWAQLFDRSAEIKAQRERQREHAQNGAA
jgi:hypothetical protein